MITKKIDWSEFKVHIDNKSLKIQFFESSTDYDLYAFDGIFGMQCLLVKDGGSGLLDFESNYKPSANSNIDLYKFNGDSLKTTSVDSINATISPGSPVLSNNYKIDWSNIKVDLPNSSAPYVELYSYAGEGKFISFSMNFNSDNVYVRLVIDNSIIFDIDCDFLESLFHNNEHTNSNRDLNWDRSKNTLSFRPNFPIKYTTSISIQSRSNSSSMSRDMKYYLVNLSKES